MNVFLCLVFVSSTFAIAVIEDRNLCKTQPDLPYCREQDLEFHISRGEVAEPEVGPSAPPKKIIEPAPVKPLLSEKDREEAIKDSKQPAAILTEDAIDSTPHRVVTRDKRHLDDDEELEYLAYRRRRARILNALRNLDDNERYRSSSRRYSPSNCCGYYNSYPRYGYGGGYPSGGYGYSQPFTFGIGSGLGIGFPYGGVGVTSGLGITVG